ncbi:MAG TPA: acyl-CoA dehydrogenase family protein, partial [Candidatus Kapabacteria bacterium]|nr:acyl-CoA dehydrogenase family protein [Candidatus Kapabacteria bacterium]
MIEWSEPQRMLRDALRNFIEKEIAPNLDQLEHGDTPPYDVLRKMLRTFGIDQMAKQRFEQQIAREKDELAGIVREKKEKTPEEQAMADMMRGEEAAMSMLPSIELCRFCPGMVTALGVSMGLTAGTIMSKGTIAQKERFVPQLLTLEKVGAWAITEPNSGSDAFGSMKA